MANEEAPEMRGPWKGTVVSFRAMGGWGLLASGERVARELKLQPESTEQIEAMQIPEESRFQHVELCSALVYACRTATSDSRGEFVMLGARDKSRKRRKKSAARMHGWI